MEVLEDVDAAALGDVVAVEDDGAESFLLTADDRGWERRLVFGLTDHLVDGVGILVLVIWTDVSYVYRETSSFTDAVRSPKAGHHDPHDRFLGSIY